MAPRPHDHLSAGLLYEQAGAHDRATAAYEAAVASDHTPAVRANAYIRLARVARAEGDWAAAKDAAGTASLIAEAAGLDDLVAEAMNADVGGHMLRGEWHEADTLAVAALQRARSERVRGIVLQNRGAIAAQRGDFVTAQEQFVASVAAFDAAGYALGSALAMTNAAAAARDAGDLDASLALAEQAAEFASSINAWDVLAVATQNQAHTLTMLGRSAEAEERLSQVLGHFAGARNPIRQAECLEIMGLMQASRSDGTATARRAFELALDLAHGVRAQALAERLRARILALGDPPDEPRSHA